MLNCHTVRQRQNYGGLYAIVGHTIRQRRNYVLSCNTGHIISRPSHDTNKISSVSYQLNLGVKLPYRTATSELRHALRYRRSHYTTSELRTKNLSCNTGHMISRTSHDTNKISSVSYRLNLGVKLTYRTATSELRHDIRYRRTYYTATSELSTIV